MKTPSQIRKEQWVEQIWREYNQELRRYIESRIADKSDADDILQELFLELYARPALYGEENERTSLYRMARKVILSYYCDNFEIEQALREIGVFEPALGKKKMPMATSILMPLYQPACNFP